MDTHIPVMVREVIDIFRADLADRASGWFVDATIGAGGHTRAILEALPWARVIGLDQDEQARDLAAKNLAEFSGRYEIIPSNFRDISAQLSGRDIDVVGVLFDLGVSNMQLTTPERGFSYNGDGPLDMRMDKGRTHITALDVLNSEDIPGLTKIFREKGEERFAYQLARGIVREREAGRSPQTTAELAALVRKILPAPVQRRSGGHPARRIFQALRIEVNGELDALTEGLDGALSVASQGCVIQVISYHSLEDRITKRKFKEASLNSVGTLITKHPMQPSEEEVSVNLSSRSAKLRAIKINKAREERRGAA